MYIIDTDKTVEWFIDTPPERYLKEQVMGQENFSFICWVHIATTINTQMPREANLVMLYCHTSFIFSWF